MDCRHSLIVGLALACLGSGCLGTGSRVPHTALRGNQAPVVASTPAPAATPAPEKGKRSPLPSTCVAYGICKEREAEKLDHEPTLQRDLRHEALTAYKEAIRLDPKHLPAHAQLGRLYVQMEDYERADETINKALERFPKESSLWFDLGMCHCRRKNWGPACKALHKALEIDPENPNVQRTLGFTLARAGLIDEGLTFLTQAQGKAQAHYSIARMLLHLQRPDEAKQHLERTLQTSPNHSAALSLMAHLNGVPNLNLVSLDINFDTPAVTPPK